MMRYVMSLMSLFVALMVVGSAFAGVPGSKVVKTISLYDPEPSNIEFFRSHELIVYSYTSRDGDQVDNVRKGNFDKECFIGDDGKIHVRRCGNLALRIGVVEEITLSAGRDGQDGKEGKDGRDGKRGDRGARGPQGLPGIGSCYSGPSYQSDQMGGYTDATYRRIEYVTASISEPIDVDIVNSNENNNINNNANNNINSNINNNVINIGEGSANGVARADSTGSAKAGAPQNAPL